MKFEVKLNKPYDCGPRNDVYPTEQHIRLTEGCPNLCPWCAEGMINGSKPVYFKIPKIVRNTVIIYDMNLIYKPKALQIIKELGKIRVDGKKVKYHLWCGIDYRFLTLELAVALKENNFINPRIAWDTEFFKQKLIRKSIETLTKAGYKNYQISVFILSNYKISYLENIQKLDLLKIWGVNVADCWFDNQLSPNIKPIYWTKKEIKDYRHKCRKHNLLIKFKIDPEVRET
jgi:hypothetical protein